MSGLIKDTAGQNVPLGTLLLLDGTEVTSGAAVKWSKDGGATAAGGGTLSHVGEGAWNYVPTQAETNCTAFQATLTKTGAVSRSVGGFTRLATPAVNVTQVGGQTASATGAVDFDDLGTAAGGAARYAGRCEVSVKSTAGLAAQVSVWLEADGVKVALSGSSPDASATVAVREHGSGTDLFTLALAAADLANDVFEAEQASPGFTDDRQYEAEVTIDYDGTTYGPFSHRLTVIG